MYCGIRKLCWVEHKFGLNRIVHGWWESCVEQEGNCQPSSHLVQASVQSVERRPTSRCERMATLRPPARSMDVTATAHQERSVRYVAHASLRGLFGKAGFFLSSLGTSFVDPVNIAASFVPVVGQARFANMVARAGLLRARIGKGAIEGFVGNAAIEPLVYGVAKSEQADYGAYDAFINLTAGTLIGSTFHVGFGKLGDFLAKKRGKPNIYQRLAAISLDTADNIITLQSRNSLNKHHFN